MADLPHTGQAEWEPGQATPWFQVNASSRAFDAFCTRITVQRRDGDPPAECQDGDCFFIIAAATGDWLGQEGGIAIAKGEDATNGWLIVPAEAIEREGKTIAVVEEGIVLRRVGGNWVEGAELFVETAGAVDNGIVRWDQSNGVLYISDDEGGGGGEEGSTSSVVMTDADDYTLLAAHVNLYIRLTASGAKQIIVQDEELEALPTNGEWHFRNVGDGDATIIPDAYTVVNPPAGGTLVIPEGGTVTLKRVAENEFDLFGLVTSA